MPRGQFNKSEKWWEARIKHGALLGGKALPEYTVWRIMRYRCKHAETYYEDVKVCERWSKFENFIADMGLRPSSKHSIDRINPFGNYEPENCRWATRSEQQLNRRNQKIYSENEIKGPLSFWSEQLGISMQLAWYRWKHWGTFIKGRKWCVQTREN